MAAIGAALVFSVTPANAVPPSQQHQSPPGCTSNNLSLDLAKDKTEIASGDTVNYTVTVGNLATGGGCDITGANVSFTCPDANGQPNGTTTPCLTNVSLPAGTNPFVACVVPCVVTVNPGVQSAQAKSDAHGILHDNPNNDLDTADLTKFISVIINFCGDGTINQTCETCDGTVFQAGAPASHGPCRSGTTCGADSCTFCGDGIVNGGEQCDDGNANDNDACRNTCVPPICGDGTINQTCETCDGTVFQAGAPASHGPCRSGTTCGADSCTFCGDGIVNGGEQCDDGNANDNDACRNTCVPPVCGDGILNQACETCDGTVFQAGAPATHGPCRTGGECGANGCTFCGDGIVNGGEECDDGNAIDTDNCRNDCTGVECGDGIINQTCETCDGNAFKAGAPATHGPCRTGTTCGADSCTFCGDGIVNGGEQCDDGNANDNDACRNTCVPPICGDGILNQTCETCDGDAFKAGAPATHGPCRTGGECGSTGCTFCGDGIVNGGEQCDDGNAVDTDACQNNCTPPQGCSVVITKTVAPDDGSGGGTACDGVADGLFVENVTVNETSCVVYQICVENTGQQILNGSGVKVSDPVLGIVNVDFGTIAVGAEVCRQTPGVITAPTCTGGSPAGTSCVCTEVEGVNTATITAAICQATQQNACAQPGSDCSDTANVACLGPGTCRMTGGHNYDVAVDASFNENGKVYTTGGQIGAPNESGCCVFPPKGKCVNGTCTGGLNGGLACTSNDQCPNDAGRNSHCPWGDWEHNHHSGPDDSNSVTGGSFAFHSGTAASPNEAFIKSVLCADPGWCVQARPAPFKQIFWEGTGVFHNTKGPKNKDIPLPIFGACGANQPVPWSNKVDGTLHYYKAHVSDFGEPAGIKQKPIGACQKDETCTNREPNQSVEINDCALGEVCLVDRLTDPVKTALHPLCEAQTCSECPDEYEIEIHCTADPNSPIAYRVSHEIREGNFQLHPPVGDSCNPGCGNGVCEGGVTGTAETCATCAEDCCP